ncbi:hypothetical protein G6F65_020006 [Rhizopus arrhizus]|nr:hypothetical protein G6F65_020006 [Rhizopus arrhizus]
MQPKNSSSKQVGQHGEQQAADDRVGDAVARPAAYPRRQHPADDKHQAAGQQGLNGRKRNHKSLRAPRGAAMQTIGTVAATSFGLWPYITAVFTTAHRDAATHAVP